MLETGRIPLETADPVRLALSPMLITQTLENLMSERCAAGGTSFAIEEFCRALTGDTQGLGHALVDRLLDCGVGVDSFYETYIPRAAARLGEMWLEDTLSFAGVTLGMARLTEVFRRLSPVFLKTRTTPARSRRALFALAPGETHALGVVMAADHFQRHGWAVRVELRATPQTLEQIAGAQEFDLIGLSAGARRSIPAVAHTVATLRRAARPGTSFALGGQLAALGEEVAAQVGVDFVGSVATRTLADIEGSL